MIINLTSFLTMVEINEKEKQLFTRFGSAASEAMFDFPCHFFQTSNCTGMIAYRIESQCAIVFGDPICPPDETFRLAEAFHDFCDKSNLNVIYITVSQEFAKWSIAHSCQILIEVCEEIVFDPKNNPCLISHRLHHRVNKALKHGLTIHEYIPVDRDIEKALQEVGIKWEQGIKGPHLHIGHLNFFESYIGKRWFYVKDGEQITAMAMLSRLDIHQGWLLKFLAILPNTFPTTSEFLVTSILEILRKENCSFLSKGMVPLNYLGEMKGFGRFSRSFLRLIYITIIMVFRFKKRKQYWMRYHPKFESTYLIFRGKRIGFNEIRALRKAFRAENSIKNLV
jgi:lysylphosphatidylglycerol synthetase-like protein (DUF2156 family)